MMKARLVGVPTAADHFTPPRYRRPDPYALRPAHTTLQPPPQIGEPAIVPDDPRYHRWMHHGHMPTGVAQQP
jgi:hypothetical protein